MDWVRRSVLGKVVLTCIVVGVGMSVAGIGTYAGFTSSATAAQTIGSGGLNLVLGATGASTNRLTVNASSIAAGDTIQRSFDLTNNGALAVSSINFTSTSSPSSLLDTDATDGLQMVIDRCSVPWTEAGTPPAHTYTCSGTTSSVVASRAVIGTNVTMNNLAAAAGNATDHLRLTLTLPSSAPNTMQDQTSTITYNFLAAQRAATNK